MSFDLPAYLRAQTARVNSALDRLLPAADTYPAVIHQAMRYSLDAGGKRLRPILVLASAAAVGGDRDALLPAACALECVHTYSLIHDDLPAMDDDDLRRGRPTNHKVFGEAIAILAGDALLTFAFQLLSEQLPQHYSPALVLQVTAELAQAAGSQGMVGGQVADVQWERGLLTGSAEATLEYIHHKKTGALLVASVRIGAWLGGADQQQLQALTAFSRQLGLAYQITDDLLDVTGTEEKLGKRVQKDADRGKLTYPGVYGIPRSRQQNQRLLTEALAQLEVFGEEAGPLRALAPFLVKRDY
ncbi:MAG: polyprenyl synthetase family protein [Bacillota bacterium]